MCHRLGSIAQTCCISQCAKYRKSGISATPGAKPLKWSPWNLGCVTRSGTLPQLPNMGAIGLRAAYRACVKYHCLWLSFFPFFRFFTSPTGRHSRPIFTIYTSNDAFLRKEVPFGGLDDEFNIYHPFPPKFENLHYGLWQLRTAITRASLKIEARCLHQSGGFRGRAIKYRSRNLPQTALCYHGNQLMIFKHKIA